MSQFDVIIVGAGAAGLFCAGVAGQLGLKVLLIDHAQQLAEKVRISGGGRCNFTNIHAQPANYLSANPHFCRSALARYTPADFISLVKRHRIGFHEKHLGQLFCDTSSEAIIELLVAECAQGNVQWLRPCAVNSVQRQGEGFVVGTASGEFNSCALVVATGGLAIPKIGATDWGYRLARQFGLKTIETRPALVPLTFDSALWQPFVPLAGASLRAKVCAQPTPLYGKKPVTFHEDLLLTHRGLSGPAILQISSYWQPGQPLTCNLAPDINLAEVLLADKSQSKQSLGNVLAHYLPRRLAEAWLTRLGLDEHKKLADMADKTLRELAQSLQAWPLIPSGTEGYKKAEVTLGGVDTRELSSTTMMAKSVPGLYFIGEVVDVTGWLGGYNFQWAWASAYAAAQGLAAQG